MTNFEYYTQNSNTLQKLLYLVQDDALAAKGCSMYLKMPDAETCMMWSDWLEAEVRND